MDKSARWKGILRRMCLGIFLFALWGTAGAGHAPIIFYNVPNWYSGGWNQIRYQTPYDAFAVEWNMHTGIFPAGCRAEVLASVYLNHIEGLPDGSIYSAMDDWYNNEDCSYGGRGKYPSDAREFANCGDPNASQLDPSAWPDRRCPDGTPDADKSRGTPTAPTRSAGDPVNPGAANKFDLRDLITGQGAFPVAFTVAYNGGQSAPILSPTQLALGARRVHNYQMRVAVETNPSLTSAYVLRPDGKMYGFDQDGASWTGDPDVEDTLESTRDAQGNITSWTYTRADKTRETYDASGTLTALISRDGLTQTLAYDTSGHLKSVTDPQGRSILFQWDNQNRISGVQGADGENYVFAYDASNNLSTITYPDSSTFEYIYGENDGTTNLAGPNDLTGQVDEFGTRVDTTKYNYVYQFSPSSTAGAAGANPTTISLVNNPATSYTVTSGLGVTETTTVSYMFGISKPMTVTRTCQGCTTQTTTYTYDANGRIATQADGNNNVTATTYDAQGLLLSKVEAQGTPSQRATETTWDSALRVPLVQAVKDASGTVKSSQGWAYNATGQTTAQCLIDPVAAPAYTCAPTGTAPTGVRRTTTTYCTTVDGSTCPLIGLPLTVDGPRTDVTDTVSYAWHPTTDESGCSTVGGICHHLGDLKSTTDGAGLVTTYVSYDKAGRMTRTKAPNGVLTDYSYTPRGWLASKTVRANTSGAASSLDAVTTVAYDPTGTVHSVTDPDGVVTTYTYDAAHRLTDITDVSGNHVHYTLDVAGNRTASQVLTSTGTVVRSLGRTFNALGQLTAMTDGLNNTVFSAGFADSYDANGNLVHSQDGLGHQTKQAFDALDRLVSTLQNYQGTDTATANSQTVNTFDALDRVNGFNDPDGLNTTYDIDALGNLAGLHSPDTGTTAHTFDVAGNPLTSVDATNNSRARTYDADNRLLTETFADTSLNVTYKYDEADSVTGCTGSFGKGHLTRVIEGNGGITWCYDYRGNVVKKQQTVGTNTRTTMYGWTTGERLASVTTPNGTLVAYTRNALGQIASIQTTPSGGAATTVVSNVVHMPFGSVASYTLGDGQAVTLTYDANGAWTDVASTAFSLHVKRDEAGNITAIGNAAGVPTPTETYSYDPLYRLTGVNAADGTSIERYTYNKTGDRLSKAAPGLLTGSYNYATGTHHLTGVGTTTRVVDARGNTTADVLASGTYGYGYNGRDRLTVIQNGGVTVGSYVLNALGQRVQKTAAGITTRFDYDEGNLLLSESAGTITRDYIWMDDVPVGIVDHTGSTTAVNFIHADGLSSPRVVTSSNGTVLWQWAYAGNPFGEKVPVSASGYALNLRFPGQYFDAESGLNYNVNRDYDPATGRYIQSDPIGLAGGISTYAYTLGNPIGFSDLSGLDVTMTCRPLRGLESFGFRHCGVFVWHYETDSCGHRHKVITNQFSLPNKGTIPAATPPTDPTYVTDRAAFNNPSGDNTNYDIAPPAGWTQSQFDNSVAQEGSSYSQGPYSLTGPNSNTAAATIIYDGGHANVNIPDVPGAVAEYYYIAPPWPMGR